MIRYLLLLVAALAAAPATLAQSASDSARWTATGELAFTDVSGNQRLSLLATGLKLGRTVPRSFETTLELQARYGRSGGDVSVENYSSVFTGRLRPGAPVSPFVSTSVLRDRFRNLDVRVAVAAGVDVRLLDGGEDELRLGVALLQDYEARDLPPDSSGARKISRTRLDLGLTGRFPLRPGVTIEHTTGFQPAASRLEDYLFTTRTALRVLLTRRLAFQTSYTFLRDNTPAPGVQFKDDRTLTTGLVLSIE